MDAQAVMLAAQAEALEIYREFMEEMTAPLIKTLVRQKWAALSPEMKDEIRERNPKNYALIKEYLDE